VLLTDECPANRRFSRQQIRFAGKNLPILRSTDGLAQKVGEKLE
jgi:hypothetical protein